MTTATLLATALGGCTLLPPDAVRQVRSAHDAYRAGRYDQAAQVLSPVILKYGQSPEVCEALYLRALCRVQQRQMGSARQDLERALPRSERVDLTALIRAQLGHLAFDEDQYPQAAALYSQAEPDLPARGPLGQVLYQHGVSLQRSGRFADARPLFARVFKEFASSPLAVNARRKYDWNRDYFTVQCGAFTKMESTREVVDELRQRGIQVWVSPETRNSENFYVVQAGRHRTYAEAAATARAIQPVVSDVFIMP